MSYYFSKTINKELKETRALVESKLKESGFGIVSEIDMTGKFKEKLGIDFRPYLILGACSPKHAHMAVTSEEHIGLMLPCNVLLQVKEPGKTEVSAVDPIASMEAVKNEKLGTVAADIQARIKEFIASL